MLTCVAHVARAPTQQLSAAPAKGQVTFPSTRELKNAHSLSQRATSAETMHMIGLQCLQLTMHAYALFITRLFSAILMFSLPYMLIMISFIGANNYPGGGAWQLWRISSH